MPAAWPPLAPLVQPLLGKPYAEYDCWGLLATLLQAGFGIDLTRDPEVLAREVVEVWFRGQSASPLLLLQPWDCLILSVHGLVGDHCGLALDPTRFVHTRHRAGVVIDALPRWQPKFLQIARLRRLL